MNMLKSCKSLEIVNGALSGYVYIVCHNRTDIRKVYNSSSLKGDRIYLLRRNAAKGGKKYAGWKTVRIVHAIASILIQRISNRIKASRRFAMNLHAI